MSITFRLERRFLLQTSKKKYRQKYRYRMKMKLRFLNTGLRLVDSFLQYIRDGVSKTLSRTSTQHTLPSSASARHPEPGTHRPVRRIQHPSGPSPITQVLSTKVPVDPCSASAIQVAAHEMVISRLKCKCFSTSCTTNFFQSIQYFSTIYNNVWDFP